MVFLWFLFLSQVFAANSTNLTSLGTNSRNFQLQGVTIGGWLLLEPYITPSLFLQFNATNGTESDIPTDEYRFCERLGKDEALSQLQDHWDTFYTKEDFDDIKELGLNMVRIPIGYWAFDQLEDDPYVYGAQEYLDKAIEWAYDADLKVWVDLHGVPESQNGFDNSGLRNLGYPGWFNSTENVNLTYSVLQQIYSKYGGSEMNSKYPDTIIGIEVVNEPKTPELDIEDIEEFYINTYRDARRIQGVNNTIVFHDAFKGLGYWNGFLNYTQHSNSTIPGNYNIMIDHHHYHVFDSNALTMTIAQHIDAFKSFSEGINDEIESHPAVVGEWLAAMTDCTPWLNGVGIGTRWEGTAPYTNDPIGKCDDINDFDAWSEERKKNYRKFIEIQLDQYESQMNGWIFWCYKTESSIEWDLSRLVELELFPQPLDDRIYIVNGTDTDPAVQDDDDDEEDGEESVGIKNTVPALLIALAFYLHLM